MSDAVDAGSTAATASAETVAAAAPVEKTIAVDSLPLISGGNSTFAAANSTFAAAIPLPPTEAVPLQTLVDEFVLLPTTATDLKEDSISAAKGEENEGKNEAQTMLPPLSLPPLPLVPLISSVPILLPYHNTTLISTAETGAEGEEKKSGEGKEKGGKDAKKGGGGEEKANEPKKQKKSRKSEDFAAPPPREPSKRARKMPDRLSSHTLSSVSLAIER